MYNNISEIEEWARCAFDAFNHGRIYNNHCGWKIERNIITIEPSTCNCKLNVKLCNEYLDIIEKIVNKYVMRHSIDCIIAKYYCGDHSDKDLYKNGVIIITRNFHMY